MHITVNSASSKTVLHIHVLSVAHVHVPIKSVHRASRQGAFIRAGTVYHTDCQAAFTQYSYSLRLQQQQFPKNAHTHTHIE